ncbi:long-chain fatty acid-CoA ligase [Ceratobasidium sp. 423]|nr:long-chain fatty acid-CoA ligase [Ceratobasidium sp. 423]
MLNTKPGSVEVGQAGKGESAIRRGRIHPDSLVERPAEGITIIHDVLQYAARTHGSKQAVGWRNIEKIVEEEKEVTKTVGGKQVTEKKVWKYFQLSDYQYWSFVEFRDYCMEAARGLVVLGVEKGKVFNIYAQTSVNWQMMAHACAAIGTPIATAYDTLGESGLQHSLDEPECQGVFTNTDLLPMLARVLSKAPTVQLVVYDGEPSDKILDEIRAVREGLTVIHLDDLRAKGRENPDVDTESRLPKTEDTACIMYTSGSTGAPKGVVLSHSNLIASLGAIKTLLGHHLKPDDAFLAYLPLAHILEYIVELALFFVGMTTGYGRVKTLTDASVRNCQGDIRALRPTIMVGVPAVWETIRKGIMGKVNASGSVRKSVFMGSMSIKKAGVPGLTQAVDSLVFNQVKQQTGGRLRLTLSGGAALSRETQEFLSLALVTVLQGYGMTESCGMCAILPPEYMSYGPVGVPVPSIEIKLLDHPEAGYLTTNDPPQGEVLIRGPSVTKGYFKRDDLNNDKEIFTSDGWFRTGDVGQWNKDGTLSIIDRIKNLVKLQSGEYIALERLESIYKSCDLVANICVHAVPDAKQPMALIYPHESNLRHFLQSANLPDVDPSAGLATLCHTKAVAEAVLKQCNIVGKKAGFKPLEILEAVVLTPEEWTPENELVTAAQKIQRKKIAQRYDKEIKEVYKGAN